MPFWSGESLVERLHRLGIVRPFRLSQIDCNSYTLRMGRQSYIPPDHTAVLSRHKIYQLDWHDHFTIPAGQFGFLLTEEIVAIPNDTMGFISLRTGLKFQGHINVSRFHVDPGFRGHLIYAVYNAGPSHINLARGMNLFKIWFADIEVAESNKYARNNPELENIYISPSLIDNVPGEILSMQTLSRRLENIERELWIYRALSAIIIGVGGLLLGLLRLTAGK